MARNQFGGSPADYVIQPNDDTNDQTLRFRPNAPLTAWDDEVAGEQITDLQLTHDGDSVSTITATATGRVPRFYGPDSATTLWIDSGDADRYLLVSTDVGALVDSKLGRDEIPAAHTHSPDDIPGLARLSGAAVLYAFFNAQTNTWPPRPDTTGPVIWIGDATIPAGAIRGLDYIDQLAASNTGGSTNIPDPTPDPDPATPDSNGVKLSAPVVSVNGGLVSLSAHVSTTAAKTFKYVQFAVRGPAGQNADPSNSYHDNVTVNGDLPVTGSFTATASGVWTVYLSYNITGGADQASWVDGTKVTFTVTLPSSPGSGGTDPNFPVLGISGLQWNSGVFVGGFNANDAYTFATYRGKALDAFETFVARATWDEMFTIDASWAPWPGILVLAIPPQPDGQNNSATANGSNNQRWADYGSKLTAAGLNRSRTVIRLGWESNGDWYSWSWGSPHNYNTPAQFVAAVKNVVTALRSTAPNVKISLNQNKNNKRSGADWRTDVMIPLLNYYDFVGLDAYDMYNASTTDALFQANMVNQDPGLASVASFCRSNGKRIGIEEWAPVRAGGADGTGGGDNPVYINNVWNWLVANKDVVAYEIFYSHPGTNDYQHLITDGSKPNAAAAYRSHLHWGNQ